MCNLKSIGLFCKRSLQKKRYSAKETYNFICRYVSTCVQICVYIRKCGKSTTKCIFSWNCHILCTHIHTNMYIYISTYPYVYVYVQTRTHMGNPENPGEKTTCTHLHIYTHIYVYTHMFTYIYIYMYTNTHTHGTWRKFWRKCFAYTHAYIHTHFNIHIHICSHMYIYTYVYINNVYICIQTHTLMENGANPGEKAIYIRIHIYTRMFTHTYVRKHTHR